VSRVVLGLSGGVDSAAAAAVLKERGYDVLGVYLDAGTGSPDAAADVAAALGIGFAVVDIRAELESLVCAPFVSAYLSGETPNPCILCNPKVKFPALLRFADENGAKFIATGHYARCENGVLYRAESENDQSYMLCRLPSEILDRLILPLGSFASKALVRQKAALLNLGCADAPDSMEICFIPDNDRVKYIESRGVIPPPGNFVSESGEVLGTHLGIHRYTVGQRRRLGIAMGERMFVSEIRGADNTIVLSPVTDISVTTARVRDLFPALEDGSFRAFVRVRHSKTLSPAVITVSGKFAAIAFDSPQRRPAPGQTCVFYSHDGAVIGCGTLAK